jgi:hypothetical protein
MEVKEWVFDFGFHFRIDLLSRNPQLLTMMSLWRARLSSTFMR